MSALFRSHPVLAIVFLAIGTLGVIGSMPIFWPVPSTFLAGTAAAAGIGIVNSVGNLGGYIGPNIPVWMKGFSADPLGLALCDRRSPAHGCPGRLHRHTGQSPEASELLTRCLGLGRCGIWLSPFPTQGSHSPSPSPRRRGAGLWQKSVSVVEEQILPLSAWADSFD